jgi:hypothetical protein
MMNVTEASKRLMGIGGGTKILGNLIRKDEGFDCFKSRSISDAWLLCSVD